MAKGEKLCACGKPVSQCTCKGHNHKVAKAQHDLNALEGKHGARVTKHAGGIVKRAAPAPKISTENKGMDSPIDMVGGMSVIKISPSAPPKPVPPKYTGNVATDSGPRGPIGTAGTDTMWAQSGSGAGTHRPSSVSVQSSGGKGAGARKVAKSAKEDAAVLRAYRSSRRARPLDPAFRQYAKAQSDTTAMPKNIMAPNNQKTGAQVLRQKAGLKKDITSGFVPSIGVKQGKKRDFQDPMTNLYPPAGKKK